MKLSKLRIKSSRKDPEYSVYEVDGKIVRAVPEIGIELLEKNNLKEFPTIKRFELAGQDQLFEVEKFPFIIYPYELPFGLLKDFSLFYINLLTFLLEKNISLKDATPYNICYNGNNSFKHFDLGSIEKYDATQGWKGYRQFLAEFYFPLLYLTENKNIYTTDLIKLFFDKQWIFKYNFNWRNYLNPGFNIHYTFYKKSAIRKLKNTSENKLTINHRLIKNNLYLLKNHITSFSLPKDKTKWDDYYSQTVLKDGYVDKKVASIKELLKNPSIKHPISYATDWGANDGKFSKLFLAEFKNATVISIESDYNAVNQLYQHCKNENIIPVYTDVLNLSPHLGFDGERLSLKSRLKSICDFQLCLGLIHHLIHQDNLSFDDVICFFSDSAKSGSYLLIEFIDAEDPRHQLIKNPNYAYSLTRSYFVESLNKHYEIIDTNQVIETRELFLCLKTT